MKKLLPLRIPAALAIAVLGLLGQGAAQAAVYNIHETEDSFRRYLEPGYYLEDFTSWELGSSWPTPQFFGPDGSLGQLYSYTVSDMGGTGFPPGFYIVERPIDSGNKALSANSLDLFITMTGDPVTAVGGEFFLTDQAGEFAEGMMTVYLNDATSVTIASSLGGFLGFTTSPQGPTIDYVWIHGINPDQEWNPLFVTMDHFFVGMDEAIPEPTTLIAGALLLLPFGVSTLRRLRRNRTA